MVRRQEAGWFCGDPSTSWLVVPPAAAKVLPHAGEPVPNVSVAQPAAPSWKVPCRQLRLVSWSVQQPGRQLVVVQVRLSAEGMVRLSAAMMTRLSAEVLVRLSAAVLSRMGHQPGISTVPGRQVWQLALRPLCRRLFHPGWGFLGCCGEATVSAGDRLTGSGCPCCGVTFGWRKMMMPRCSRATADETR